MRVFLARTAASNLPLPGQTPRMADIAVLLEPAYPLSRPSGFRPVVYGH